MIDFFVVVVLLLLLFFAATSTAIAAAADALINILVSTCKNSLNLCDKVDVYMFLLLQTAVP